MDSISYKKKYVQLKKQYLAKGGMSAPFEHVSAHEMSYINKNAFIDVLGMLKDHIISHLRVSEFKFRYVKSYHQYTVIIHTSMNEAPSLTNSTDIENTFVAEDPENNHFWYPANDAIHLYVNTKEKPFDDLVVRKALSMALNRDEIVDIAAYGYPTANFNAGGIGDLYGKFVNKDIAEKYKEVTTYNPEKAKQMLDDAGYIDSDDDGYREMADGKKIQFDINVVNGWTDWIQVVQMVTEYYQEIGIKANEKTVDWSVYDSA